MATFSPVWPPKRRQQRVRSFPLDDLGHHFPGQRFNVGPIRRVGIGHDRGGIAVDQHHLVLLFAQGLAGLRPRIVELAGLSDHDRAGPDQQDFSQVVTSWHAEGSFFGWVASVQQTSDIRPCAGQFPPQHDNRLPWRVHTPALPQGHLGRVKSLKVNTARATTGKGMDEKLLDCLDIAQARWTRVDSAQHPA